jgi:uncharacterized protein
VSVTVTRDEASAEFYDACARHELLLRRCARCTSWAAPSIVSCPSCHSGELRWEPADGSATLVSWTVVHGRPTEDGGPAPSTVAGLVELAEGPWLHARLVDTDPDSLTAGQKLIVGFETPGDGEAVPIFRLVV